MHIANEEEVKFKPRSHPRQHRGQPSLTQGERRGEVHRTYIPGIPTQTQGYETTMRAIVYNAAKLLLIKLTLRQQAVRRGTSFAVKQHLEEDDVRNILHT